MALFYDSILEIREQVPIIACPPSHQLHPDVCIIIVLSQLLDILNDRKVLLQFPNQSFDIGFIITMYIQFDSPLDFNTIFLIEFAPIMKKTIVIDFIYHIWNHQFSHFSHNFVESLRIVSKHCAISFYIFFGGSLFCFKLLNQFISVFFILFLILTINFFFCA